MPTLNLKSIRIPAAVIEYTHEGYNLDGVATISDHTRDPYHYDMAAAKHRECEYVEHGSRSFYCHECAYGVRFEG